MKRVTLFAVTTLVVAALASCGSDVDNLFDETPDGSGGAGTGAEGPGGPGPGPGPGPGGSTGEAAGPASSSSGEGGAPCRPGPDEDNDGDGITVLAGDCNDCDPLLGPGSIEVTGNDADEDCDGNLD